MTQINVYLYGPPGCGKSTAFSLFKTSLRQPFSEIQTGHIFRNAKLGGAYEWVWHKIPSVAATIAGGRLVNSPDTVRVVRLEEERNRHKPGSKLRFYDGFPRTQAQLWANDKHNNYLRRLGQRIIEVHVLFELAKEEAEKRMNLGDTTDRQDRSDRGKAKKRLHTYFSQTAPMIETLRQQGRLLVVDASLTREEVASLAKQVIAQSLESRNISGLVG